MLKYIGAVIVFAACALSGATLCEREKLKLCQCEAFLELFEYVKNQIHYFLAPTKQIYRGFENTVLEKTGFLTRLCEENDGVYRNNWIEAFEQCAENIYLSGAQADIVKAFGSHVGKSNEPMQTRNFEYCIKAMETEVTRQKSLCEKNTRLYRTLGITLGAMMAILMI